MKLRLLGLFILLSATSCAAISPPAQTAERQLNSQTASLPGLHIEAMEEGRWFVIHINALQAPLFLFTQPQTTDLSVSEIAQQNNLALVINAAMFAKDKKTSVGYMRNFENINNPRFHPKMQGFFMFNPKNPGNLPVKIGGKKDIEEYETVFQTYRMWSAEEGILWKKGSSIYHRVNLVGADREGNALFFFHPSYIDMHDFVEKIIAQFPDLQGLLYLDGGTHGVFYLDESLGRSWNTFRYLPNLLGIRK